VRHLRGADRVIVAFEEQDRAWVVLVGAHTDDRVSNVYDLLYRNADRTRRATYQASVLRRRRCGTGQR
jgi:hypothetical protein